jgi:tRNA pseudouridine55 synthase
MSSFRALRPLKRLFKGSKIGHAGTLDPDATGLLIAAIGPATRLIEFIQDQPKTYQFDVIPGVVTDSYDMSGEVLEKKEAPLISPEQIESTLKSLTGHFDQKPPVFSAIKIHGKRACDRVRSGEVVEVKPRKITVYSWKILSIQKELWQFEVHCSKGTYVRSLGHDLGQALGCGAAVDNIFRKQIGSYTCSNAISINTLDELPSHEEVPLLPLQQATQDFTKAYVTPKGKDLIANGNPLKPTEYKITPEEEALDSPYIQILDAEETLLALGNINDQSLLCPQRVLITNS